MNDGWQGKFGMLGVAVVAFVFIVGLILWLADHGPKTRREKWQLAVFLGPGAVLLTVGMIYPSIKTFIYSFQDSSSEKFVGLENYSWIFTNKEILVVLRNTAIWVAIGPLLTVSTGLLFAVLVDKKRGEAFSKSAIFLPMAISAVGSAIIWKFVFAYRDPEIDQIGLLNQVVIWLGLTPPDGGWLQWSPPLNTLLLILAYWWGQTGFGMVLLSAAIKSIPTEMIEAARLDGVNAWQLFWRITVPSIRPALITVYMTVLIFALKGFDTVITMTGGNFDTSVLAYEMYFRSFPGQQPGQGSALAMLLFLLVIPAVVYQVRQIRTQKEIR